MAGDRDELGRFKKGHKVPSPRAGRPARANVTSMLVAVAEQAYTPDEVVDLLYETVEMARKNDDWKGMFQVAQFIVYYAVGKPVQRTLSATVDPDMVRKLFQGARDQDEDGDDDDVVDIDAS